MGRVMGCGLCPYNAIEKVGNYGFSLARETLYRLVGYESVKGLPSETNFFISD